MRRELLTLSRLLAAIGCLGAQGAELQHEGSLMIEARAESLCNYYCAPFEHFTFASM
jgi:hypothetical protein